MKVTTGPNLAALAKSATFFVPDDVPMHVDVGVAQPQGQTVTEQPAPAPASVDEPTPEPEAAPVEEAPAEEAAAEEPAEGSEQDLINMAPAKLRRATLKETMQAVETDRADLEKQIRGPGKKPVAPAAGEPVDLERRVYEQHAEEAIRGKGKLSEATLRGLRGTGASDAQSQAHAKTVYATYERNMATGAAVFTSEDIRDKAMAFAKTLPSGQRKGLIEGVYSDDLDEVRGSFATLKAVYEAAKGRAPRLEEPRGRAPQGPTRYQSQTEMIDEMAHPEYELDTPMGRQLRATVNRRLGLA